MSAFKNSEMGLAKWGYILNKISNSLVQKEKRLIAPQASPVKEALKTLLPTQVVALGILVRILIPCAALLIPK